MFPLLLKIKGFNFFIKNMTAVFFLYGCFKMAAKKLKPSLKNLRNNSIFQ